jgi:hypothetical protein
VSVPVSVVVSLPVSVVSVVELVLVDALVVSELVEPSSPAGVPQPTSTSASRCE